jgi:adenylosuccinate lyase
MEFNFDTYLSPFTWRYGSPEMRKLWSETYKRSLWRKVWLALAEVEAQYGLVSDEQLGELRAQVSAIDISRAMEIESVIHHDLMAELKTYAEQCPNAGGVLHLGATSMDIEDNADVLRIRQSIDLIIMRVADLLEEFSSQIERYADTVMIAYTHLQPAETSTIGYRFSLYAQDLLSDWENLRRVRAHLRGKGFKGAVGTGAAFAQLVGLPNMPEFEARLSTYLGLPFYPVASQVYPRKQDYQLLSALAGLGASLYKFAFDLRLLQSPSIGEMAEPFGEFQVGSSAMPFKRNPIQAEKIDSLARSLAQLPRIAWDNAAHSLLERTLDDSANRRSILPESFLITDELLLVTTRIISRLQLDENKTAQNLATYGPFAGIEPVLMALGKKGVDRQVMHERFRQYAMGAWTEIQNGAPNPLVELISDDEQVRVHLKEHEVRELMAVNHYIGDAPQRSRQLVHVIREALTAFTS